MRAVVRRPGRLLGPQRMRTAWERHHHKQQRAGRGQRDHQRYSDQRRHVHSCALLAGGQVDCWGSNDSGSLGTAPPLTAACRSRSAGSPTPPRSAPATITHALLSPAATSTAGATTKRRVGNGSTTNSSVPVAVSGITNATRSAPAPATRALCSRAAKSTAGATTHTVSWERQHHEQQRARRGQRDHHRDSDQRRMRTTRALSSRAAKSTAGARTYKGSWVTAAPTEQQRAGRGQRDPIGAAP